MDRVIQELVLHSDPDYQTFVTKLMPTVDPARVMGVRIPYLRKFARQLVRDGLAEELLAELPHPTFEEDIVHGALIGILSKKPTDAYPLLDRFLPYVDNWSVCDSIAVPAFKRDLWGAYPKLVAWTESPHEYAVRFAIVQLMKLYLGEAFSPEQLFLVADIRRDELYINMARAWYFSMALAKRYDETVPLFEEPVLDPWTHNKALQKARESRQLSPIQKDYLQSLKVSLKEK